MLPHHGDAVRSTPCLLDLGEFEVQGVGRIEQTKAKSDRFLGTVVLPCRSPDACQFERGVLELRDGTLADLASPRDRQVFEGFTSHEVQGSSEFASGGFRREVTGEGEMRQGAVEVTTHVAGQADPFGLGVPGDEGFAVGAITQRRAASAPRMQITGRDTRRVWNTSDR